MKYHTLLSKDPLWRYSIYGSCFCRRPGFDQSDKTNNMEFKPLLIGCRSYDRVEMADRIYADFFWSFTLTLPKITRSFPDISP